MGSGTSSHDATITSHLDPVFETEKDDFAPKKLSWEISKPSKKSGSFEVFKQNTEASNTFSNKAFKVIISGRLLS